MAGKELTMEEFKRGYNEKYGKTRKKELTMEEFKRGYNEKYGKTRKRELTVEEFKDDYNVNYGTNQNAVGDDAFNYAVNKIGGSAVSTSLIHGLSEDMQNKMEANRARRVEQENGAQQKKIEEYNARKEEALKGVSAEGIKLLDDYNKAKGSWENQPITGDIGYTQIIMGYQSIMEEAKNTMMKEYGISDDEFAKLAQYRKENKDAELTRQLIQGVEEDIKENPALYGTLYSAVDVATSPFAGVIATGESINRRSYADKEAPVNTNSPAYLLQNFAQATEAAVNNEINNDVGEFAYNVAMSTGKAGVAILVGAGVAGALGVTGKAAQVVSQLVTLPTFGTSAYASTLQADQDKGISTENATKHAIVAGLTEMATELLPLEELFKIVGSSGKATAKQTILNILKQAGLEGTEEGIAGIANNIADNIINGDMSEYNMRIQYYIENGMSEEDARKQASEDFYEEIMQDVLAGTISGAAMGGGATVAGKIYYNNLGVEVNSDAELKEKVVEAAMTMDDSTTAKEIVSGKDAKELTNSEMARVLESMDTIEGNEAVDEVRGQIVERTQKRADLRHAEGAQAQNTANKNVQTAQITHATRAEGSTATQSISQPVNIRKKKYSSVGNALLNASAQPIIAVQLENITNNEATVRIDNPDGGEQVVKLSEITMQDETKQQLYNFASKMDTAKVGNAVINNYSGEPLDTYAEACAVFYYGGKLGTSSFEQLISNPKNTRLAAGVTDVSTLKLLYEMGVNNRSQKNTEVAPVQRKTENRQAGTVTDNRTNKSDNRMKEVAEVVAKRTGLEITLNDNLEQGENGHFQQALSRIALSETSQNQFETLVHELNEFAGTYNPEGMKKVMDVVLDYAQSKEGAAYLTKRVQQYQDAYRKVESDKTYEGAAEEFVFDYLAGVFSQKEGVESFIQFMANENMPETEQKSIIDTVADFFKQLFHKISAYLEEHIMLDTARRGLEADAQKAKEIREMVLEVWEEAIAESKVTENVSAGKKYSFAGKKSNTAEKSTFEAAEDMYFEGIDYETIRQETGWYRGYDGMWRYEIDDSRMQLKTNANPRTLGELVEHKELFEAYPQLASVRVEFVNEKGISGSYNHGSNLITLSSELMQRPDDLKYTLIHEIQHAIQHIEGFTTGATVAYWDKRLQNGYDSRTIKAQREYVQLRKEYQDVKEENPVFVAEMEALLTQTPTVPRAQMNWETFEPIGEDPVEWQKFDAERDRLSEKYGEDKVFDFMDLKSNLSDAETKGGRTAEDLYYATAGEIEARDVSQRLSYDENERKQQSPRSRVENTEKDDVVFSSQRGVSYSIDVDIDAEIKSYGVETKFNDYIGMQKGVVSTLREEGFFDNNVVTNEETGMQIAITTKGIKETLGSGNRFQTLPRELKRLKVATIRALPEIIEKGRLKEDNVGNIHGNEPLFAYFITPIRIQGEEVDVKVSVKKSTEANKFWIHNVIIEKSSEQLNPDLNQDIHELGNFLKEIDSGDVASKGTQRNNQSLDKSKPQNNSDVKKYSINIDDSLFNALEDTYTEQEQGDASIVQQGFEALKNVSVDEKLMNRIAYAIKKDYQSAYDKEQLTENLTRVFAYLKDTQNVQYEDMVRIVREIAKPVLEQSTDINEYEKQMYDDFRNYFKGMKIALTEEQMAEVAHYHGSYENFRRMNFGKITFDINGTSLDNLWEEICQHSYGMLDEYASVADQPILLMDLMNELKPAKRNIYGMNIDQASYDLALDIFRRFFVEQAQEKANAKVNEKTARLVKRQQEYRQRVNEEYRGKLERMKNSEAERRERLKEYYEDKIDDMKRSRDAALEHKDKQAAEQFAKQADRYVKLLNKVQQTNDAMIKLKAAQRQNTVDRHRNEDIRRYRERIKRNASGIITYFNTNTDKRHVPEALKDAVAQFITSIDFVSERANPDSMAQLEWQNSLRKLKDRLGNQEKAAEEGYEEIYNTLMDRDSGDTRVSSLLNDMQDFLDKNENIRVTDLGMRELKQLDEMMTALKRAITTVNQLYVNKRTNDVTQLGNASIADLERKKDKKVSASKAVQMADNLLNVNMLDARSFFSTLGENAMSIYDGLRTGFSERVWLIKEAQEHIEKILEGKNIYNWTGENAKVHTFIVNGKELRMTTGQIMSLYELKERRQADIHMKVGGIIPTDFKSSSKSVEIKGKEYGVGKKTIEHRAKGIPLTDYDVDLICNVLTEEQMQVADAMQQFLANNCAAWGNRASMKMYGYKRFGVKDYFPIKTDGMSVDTKDDSKFFGTKNRGFTKETMKNASNALMVDDIFDVFTNHVTEMATYSTFTAPLMDAMKWFNYKQKSFNGKFSVQENTIKSEINRVYGKHYIEYFQKLIKDINAESAKGIESQISDHMVSRMKAASVGANLRVAIQQPTAYIRAAAVMDPKYLAKAVFTKVGTKKALEHSAIAQWKSWGYFETSIGRSMKNVITGQDTLRNKVVEKSMWLAQKGDDFTWGYLWNACEAEIRDKHPDLEYNSKEFLTAVSGRFDEVVDQTQVVDTVLHRSHMMRSDNGAVQMATAFMSEPTKSYNLLMNAVRDVQEGGGKKAVKYFGRVAIAYTATQTINAAVTAIIDAMRDLDDDDDTFWENWSQAFGENVKDNINPLGMLPYVKDVISILEGYDVSRLDMQGISKLVSAGQKMYKYATDEDYRKKHTWFSVMKSFVYGLSQVGGVPAYNLMRDVEGLYHTVTGDFMGGIKRTNNRNYELMTDAYVDKDSASYEKVELELIEFGVEEDDILNGILTEMGERYRAGTIERSVVEEFMRTEKDMEDKDIFMKIRTWDYKKEYPEGEYNSGYAYLYHYLDTARESGKVEDRKDIQSEIRLLMKNGVEKKDINSCITRHFKEEYLEAKKSGSHAKLKNLIISVYMMLGISHEDANKKIDAWK